MPNIFERLQEDKIVYKEGDEYVFTIGDSLTLAENDIIEAAYGDDYNVRIYTGYGDDLMNAIVLKDVENVNQDLQTFLVNNVGHNCYTYDEDEDVQAKSMQALGNLE